MDLEAVEAAVAEARALEAGDKRLVRSLSRLVSRVQAAVRPLGLGLRLEPDDPDHVYLEELATGQRVLTVDDEALEEMARLLDGLDPQSENFLGHLHHQIFLLVHEGTATGAQARRALIKYGHALEAARDDFFDEFRSLEPLLKRKMSPEA